MKRAKGRDICNFYSYSQGRCSSIKYVDLGKAPIIIDVSECPVIKAGKKCSNFTYWGDKYGTIDE